MTRMSTTILAESGNGSEARASSKGAWVARTHTRPHPHTLTHSRTRFLAFSSLRI